MGMSWNGTNDGTSGGENGTTKTTGQLPWWYAVFVDGIGKVGFPIVVSSYMLYRLDGQIQQLIHACAR